MPSAQELLDLKKFAEDAKAARHLALDAETMGDIVNYAGELFDHDGLRAAQRAIVQELDASKTSERTDREFGLKLDARRLARELRDGMLRQTRKEAINMTAAVARSAQSLLPALDRVDAERAAKDQAARTEAFRQGRAETFTTAAAVARQADSLLPAIDKVDAMRAAKDQASRIAALHESRRVETAKTSAAVARQADSLLPALDKVDAMRAAKDQAARMAALHESRRVETAKTAAAVARQADSLLPAIDKVDAMRAAKDEAIRMQERRERAQVFKSAAAVAAGEAGSRRTALLSVDAERAEVDRLNRGDVWDDVPHETKRKIYLQVLKQKYSNIFWDSKPEDLARPGHIANFGDEELKKISKQLGFYKVKSFHQVSMANGAYYMELPHEVVGFDLKLGPEICRDIIDVRDTAHGFPLKEIIDNWNAAKRLGFKGVRDDSRTNLRFEIGKTRLITNAAQDCIITYFRVMN